MPKITDSSPSMFFESFEKNGAIPLRCFGSATRFLETYEEHMRKLSMTHFDFLAVNLKQYPNDVDALLDMAKLLIRSKVNVHGLTFERIEQVYEIGSSAASGKYQILEARLIQRRLSVIEALFAVKGWAVNRADGLAWKYQKAESEAEQKRAQKESERAAKEEQAERERIESTIERQRQLLASHREEIRSRESKAKTCLQIINESKRRLYELDRVGKKA